VRLYEKSSYGIGSVSNAAGSTSALSDAPAAFPSSLIPYQRVWRSILAHDAHAGFRIGGVHQWPPPKPEVDSTKTVKAAIDMKDTPTTHLQTTRGKGIICIDTRLDSFGGGYRKQNAQGRIEPTAPAPATSTPENVFLDTGCLKHTANPPNPSSPTHDDSYEDTPFAGLFALRSREKTGPDAPTANPPTAADFDPDEKPQGSASWLESAVNVAETAIGVDFDGDGDVGMTGHKQQPNVLFRAMTGFMERFSGHEPQAEKDVEQDVEPKIAEANVPVLASYRATDYSGRESRAFSMTDRAARNTAVSSETKLMAALDDDKPTNSGGNTFRSRMQNVNNGGVSCRLRHAKGAMLSPESSSSKPQMSTLAPKFLSLSSELDALKEEDKDNLFEEAQEGVDHLVAALSSRISKQSAIPEVASATTTRISTGEIVSVAISDESQKPTDEKKATAFDYVASSSRSSVVRPEMVAQLDVSRVSDMMASEVSNDVFGDSDVNQRSSKGSLSARICVSSLKVEDGTRAGPLLSARAMSGGASGAQTARTFAAIRRLQMRRGSVSARAPATMGAEKLLEMMKQRRECDDERKALRDAPPLSHRGGIESCKARSCTLSTAALMRTESAQDQQQRVAAERSRLPSPPHTIIATANSGSFSREMVRTLIQKKDHDSLMKKDANAMTSAATRSTTRSTTRPALPTDCANASSSVMQVGELEPSFDAGEEPIAETTLASVAVPAVEQPAEEPAEEPARMVVNLSDSGKLRRAMRNAGAETSNPSELDMLMPRASQLPAPGGNFRPSTCSRQYSGSVADSVRESIRASKKGSQYGSMQGSSTSHVSKPPSHLHLHHESRDFSRRHGDQHWNRHHEQQARHDDSDYTSHHDGRDTHHHAHDYRASQQPVKSTDKTSRLNSYDKPNSTHYESNSRICYGTTQGGHPGSSKKLFSHTAREPLRQRTRQHQDQDFLRSSRHLKLRHETSEKTAKRLLSPHGEPVSELALVVLGKAVNKRDTREHKREERMSSSATDLLAPPDDDDVGRASAKLHANYAFKVALYADEIEERVPAIVVWRFKKAIFLRLSNREPRFRAARGFYADMNTACTQTQRPYYGFNVVKLLEARAATQESALPDDIATPRNARRYELVYRMHYNEAGRVRSMFELKVVVHATSDGGLLHLRLAQMRLKGQEHILGERNLETLALQSPTDKPTIMFTPQLFRNIHSVAISFFFVRNWQRRLSREVWTALGQLSDRDWSQFHRIRQHFVREYRKNLEASHMAIDELDQYTEVDA